MAPTTLAVNHLFFADDSLLLFKASVEGANRVSNLLHAYCNASGQRINNEKSSIFFSKGCPILTRESLKKILNVQNETLSAKYLGLPIEVGHSKNGTFKYIRDRIWDKIKGWMAKLLASAGKEVLRKSIAQVIHVFLMSCFRLPRGLCESITSMIRKFYWGAKQGKMKTAWVAWDSMVQPKNLGSLGFRDMEFFNLALLSIQAWRILQQPNSLSARILKAVYYPDTSILNASLGSHPSQIWRAILDDRDILAEVQGRWYSDLVRKLAVAHWVYEAYHLPGCSTASEGLPAD